MNDDGAPEARVEPPVQIETRPFRVAQSASALRRTIRRTELHLIVPLGDTTIYEMEQRGEFPRRFFLTPRCVVWDLAEVEAWVDARRCNSTPPTRKQIGPDVQLRKTRPVRRRRD
jgi:prophage regulatory protein